MPEKETPTVAGLIAKHGEDIAFVAEEPLATTLDEFIDQLDTVADRFEDARINGHESARDAHGTLSDARACDEADQGAFLRLAGKHLADIDDWTEEYRLML